MPGKLQKKKAVKGTVTLNSMIQKKKLLKSTKILKTKSY